MERADPARQLLAQARAWFSPHASVAGAVSVEAPSIKAVLIWMNQADVLLKDPSWTPNNSTEA